MPFRFVLFSILLAAAIPHSSDARNLSERELAYAALPGEALVRLKELPPGGAVGHCQIAATFPKCGWHLVHGPEGLSTGQLLRDLENHPLVEAVEPNYRIELFAGGAQRHMEELWGLEKIQASNAWESVTAVGATVVAVLDSGLHYEHPELRDYVWRNPGEIEGNGIDDDNNGYVDDIRGIDVYEGDSDPRDDTGHGTHVSGTIVAAGNPSLHTGDPWKTKVMPVRIFSPDGFSGIASAIEAYEYVLAHKDRGVNVRVINNSWGGKFPSAAMRDIIREAEENGILTVCAAGNASFNNDFQPSYPAKYDGDGVLAVTASGPEDEAPAFASIGKQSVDLAAPGVGILSAYKDLATYSESSGTSMAAPHASAAAAVLFLQRPTLEPAEVRRVLMMSVDLIPGWEDRCLSGGRLNMAQAIQTLKSLRGIPQFDVPSPRFRSLSRSAPSEPSNGSAFSPSISADGRWLVFASEATNLSAADSNTRDDVYLHDLQTGEVTLVSRNPAGQAANGASQNPRISADGAFICFESEASDLRSGDSNAASDVYRYERSTGAIRLVSATFNGSSGNGPSGSPSISGDGRWITFHSAAENLHSADVNGTWDVFVADMASGSIDLVSIASDQLSGFGPSSFPVISENGRWIAFQSLAFDLVQMDGNDAWDIFVRDRIGRATTLVSVTDTGSQALGHSGSPSISADGRIVAFESDAANLTPGGGPAPSHSKVYWRRWASPGTQSVSVGARGATTYAEEFGPALDPKGQWIAFLSGDLTNGIPFQLFVQKLADKDSAQLTWNAFGEVASDSSFAPAWTSDGRLVCATWAENLVDGDGNLALDIVMFDLAPVRGDLMISDVPSGGWIGDGAVGTAIPQSAAEQITSVTRFFLWLKNRGNESAAFEVRHPHVPEEFVMRTFHRIDFDRRERVELSDGWLTPSMQAGQIIRLEIEIETVLGEAPSAGLELPITLTDPVTDEPLDKVTLVALRHLSPPGKKFVSRASMGELGRGNSAGSRISQNGHWVVFSSDADNLTPNDFNAADDIFLYLKPGSILQCLSKTANDLTGFGRSFSPVISGDGLWVAFESTANNLLDSDSATPHVFVWSRMAQRHWRMSETSSESLGNHASGSPSISEDGSVIAFHSYATNLAGRGINGVADIVVTGGVNTPEFRVFERIQRLDGAQGNGDSLNPILSAGGEFVLFDSFADNFADDDDNHRQDVFLFERSTGKIELISRTPNGAVGSRESSGAGVSLNGQWIVFNTSSPELLGEATGQGLLLDRASAEVTHLHGSASSITSDGRWIGLTIQAEDGMAQAAAYDRISQKVVVLNQDWNPGAPAFESFSPSLSGDGRFAAFISAPVSWGGGSATQALLADAAEFDVAPLLRRSIVGAEFRVVSEAALPPFEFTLNADQPAWALLRIENRGTHPDQVKLTRTGAWSMAEARVRVLTGAPFEIIGPSAGWTSPVIDSGEALDIEMEFRLTGSEVEDRILALRVESLQTARGGDPIEFLIRPDSDRDQMPDSWERTYFNGSLAAAGAGSDSDHDGVVDWREYIAGTIPNDAGSRPSITSIIPLESGAVQLGWVTAPNRWYQIEKSGNLGEPFAPVTDQLEEPTQSFVDESPGGQAYYRLRIFLW